MKTAKFIGIVVLTCCWSISLTAQTLPDSIRSLPLWKQMRYKYGLPINGGQRDSKTTREKKQTWMKDRQGRVDLLLLPYSLGASRMTSPLTYLSDTQFAVSMSLGLEYFNGNNDSYILKVFFAATPYREVENLYYKENGNFSWMYTDTENILHLGASLSRKIYWKSFSLSYGVSLQRNKWKYSSWYKIPYEDHRHAEDNKTRKARTNYSTVIGTPVSLAYDFSRGFSIGINYQPSLFRISGKQKNIYEHNISLDFQFRIAVFKPKK